MITLTSFVEAKDGGYGVPVSGARWSPDFARKWPVVEWAKPLYPNGQPIKLRDFGDEPLAPYSEYMLELYRSRLPEIREWVERYRALGQQDIAICCWCPYTKTAKAQMRKFHSFHCHLGIVAKVLDGFGLQWEFGPEHEARMVH